MGSYGTFAEVRGKDGVRREILGSQADRVIADALVNLTEYYAAIREDDGSVYAFVAMVSWSRSGEFWHKPMDEFSGPAISSCPAKILDLLSPIAGCFHPETFCRYCDAELWPDGNGELGDRWHSIAREGQRPEIAGHHCYSGFRSDAPKDPSVGRPLHRPQKDDTESPHCSKCWAKAWRQRCREAIATREAKTALMANGARVKLAEGELNRFRLDFTETVFTVRKERRTLRLVANGTAYRFPANTQFEAVKS